MSLLKIGVLASGRGSNLQSIIDAILCRRLKAEVAVLITDNQGAQAIERAKAHGIEYHVLQPSKYESKEHYYLAVTDMLKKKAVGLVVLAGFMRIVGKALIDAFPNRIMNIHPALLPSFPGLHGQGQAVAYGVRISGCTVHFVDEGMDTGPVIIQAAVPVSHNDTEADLSEKILSLEHKIYPEAIKLFAEGRLEVRGRIVAIKGYTPPENELINPPLSPD